ncbi:MAG: asparagine synthase-related protein [Croceibacterium sp.]
MSGFVAIVRFDRAPVNPAALAGMTDAIAYRGPDGISAWTGEGASIVHLALHTTEESLGEIQPLLNEAGTLVLAMDGWLANYQELREDLLARGACLRTRSDAELVLRAYEQWGDECPSHIDGEYAFLVWDMRRREAFCVRDHAGMRPLHYHWDGKRLLVASDIAGVIAANDFETLPNLGMIAEHMANEWYSLEETLWQGVTRLRPAHTMRVGRSGPSHRRHWLPPLEVSIRHARDEDYQAEYREIFAQSVRRASRTHKPLACEVSGGHDSSAIFAMAQRLTQQGSLKAPSLKGYTYNFGEDAVEAVDEIDFARAVGTHLGVKIREVRPFMPELEWFLERGQRDRDMAPYANAAMAVSIGEALKQDGCVVALNGEGGDEFLGTASYNYAEHLTELDWRSFRDSLREDFAAFGVRQALRDVLQYGIWPFVPAPIRALRFNIASLRTTGRSLLTPAMLELIEQRRLKHESERRLVRNPARRSMFSILEYGFNSYAHEFMARNCARLGYELRSPMYDRKFIEYAFAIPDRQKRQGDFQKRVHIKAMATDLPASVVNRRTKSEFSSPFTQPLDKARYSVIRPMLQCGIEWFDPEVLDRFYDCCDGRLSSSTSAIYPLWGAYGCLNLFHSQEAS